MRDYVIGACLALFVPLLTSSIAWSQDSLSCIRVDTIDVKGSTLLEADTIDKIVGDYQGRCIGIGEFNEIMEKLTEAYIDKGYITSRIYLPEQDLADGSLELSAVEGKIKEIRINGEHNAKWQRMAMPPIEGEVANIRDIEQGLDNMREMQSYDVSMEIEASEDPGQSTLLINATSEKPWVLEYSANNYSEDPMGEYSSMLDLTLDNAFGINDIWAFNYTKTMSPTPLAFNYDGDGSESWSASVTVPYGYWRQNFKIAGSTYTSHTAGTNSPIKTDGDTSSLDYELRRLLYRDQVRKDYLTFSLGRKDAKNYTLGILTGINSRVTSKARLEYSTSYPVGKEKKGNLSWKAAIEKGLPFFGSEDYNDMPSGSPNAQYTLYDASLDFSRQWAMEKVNISYALTTSAQASFDRLYSAQSYSLGGSDTIRGAVGSLAEGNSGVFVRNDFNFAFPEQGDGKLQPTLYAGIDIGHIFEQKKFNIDAWSGAGLAAGIKIQVNKTNIDIGAGQVIYRSDDQVLPYGRVFVTFSHKF